MEECESTAVQEMKEGEESEPKKELYQWKEITTEFFQSVQELQLGELLHFELFGLFEAMSAIEMMDKKMDIGMVDGKEKVPLTFDSALKVRQILHNFPLDSN
jgi:hypothetical protein